MKLYHSNNFPPGQRRSHYRDNAITIPTLPASQALLIHNFDSQQTWPELSLPLPWLTSQWPTHTPQPAAGVAKRTRDRSMATKRRNYRQGTVWKCEIFALVAALLSTALGCTQPADKYTWKTDIRQVLIGTKYDNSIPVHVKVCEHILSDLHATRSCSHPSAQHKKTEELSSSIRYGYYTLEITSNSLFGSKAI